MLIKTTWKKKIKLNKFRLSSGELFFALKLPKTWDRVYHIDFSDYAGNLRNLIGWFRIYWTLNIEH